MNEEGREYKDQRSVREGSMQEAKPSVDFLVSALPPCLSPEFSSCPPRIVSHLSDADDRDNYPDLVDAAVSVVASQILQDAPVGEDLPPEYWTEVADTQLTEHYAAFFRNLVEGLDTDVNGADEFWDAAWAADAEAAEEEEDDDEERQ